jgi:hypothetical protein
MRRAEHRTVTEPQRHDVYISTASFLFRVYVIFPAGIQRSVQRLAGQQGGLGSSPSGGQNVSFFRDVVISSVAYAPSYPIGTGFKEPEGEAGHLSPK